jgi:hypothetical protein
VQGYGCQRSRSAQHTVYQMAESSSKKEPHWSGAIGALPQPHHSPYPLHWGLSFILQDCLGHVPNNEAEELFLTTCIRADMQDPSLSLYHVVARESSQSVVGCFNACQIGPDGILEGIASR